MRKEKSHTAAYLKEIARRGKESHVYQKHQLVGLMIAELLHDEKHKSLYMKLAKTKNPDDLIALAKDIADRKNINNKGAYFMSIITDDTPHPRRIQ